MRVTLMIWMCAAIWASGAFAVPPLSVYGQLPAIEAGAVSVSGDHVALVAQVDEARRVLIYDGSGQLLKIVETGDAKVRDIKWAGDECVLLDVSQTVSLVGFTAHKAELWTTMVVPVADAPPFAVFARDRDITGGVMGAYGVAQREGRWYGYFSALTLERSALSGQEHLKTDPTLFEVDLRTGKKRQVARRIEGDDISRRWLVDDKGDVAAMLDFISTAGDWRIRNGEGTIIAQGREPLGDVGMLAFGREPGTLIYYRTHENGEGTAWFSIPLSGGASTPFLDKADIRLFYRDAARRMLGYMRQGNAMETHFFDPRHQKVAEATKRAFPNMNVRIEDADTSFNRLLVTTDGHGDPETWWLVDIRTGKAEPLGTAYPIAPADVGDVKVIRYRASDGLEIEGILTLPPGRQPAGLPVVILPHGGPASRDYAHFDWLAQSFASRGYAVLQPNFRGSTGYGEAFERAGHGQWGLKMQTDVSEGLAEIVKLGIADPKRACIAGASYGGYAALAGVTLQQGLYRCAVAIAGVSDVAEMVRTDMRESGGNQMVRRSLTATVGKGRDLAAVSPVNFAARADAPVLLIHGKDDTVVQYTQSTRMLRALKNANKPVELVTLDKEDHWLSYGATRKAMLQAAMDFVQRHNPPDPEPVKP